MNLPTPPELRDPQFAPSVVEDEMFNLRAALATVLDHWLLALFVLAAFMATGLFKAWVTPWAYESSALIEIESRSSGFALSPEMFGGSSYFTPEMTGAQIEILKSRSILGAAAEQLGLTINSQPRHMGSIGAAMARRYRGKGVASDPWWIPMSGKYAWGGEVIEVASLKLPDSHQNAAQILVAGEGGTYTIRSHDDVVLGTGKVGTEFVAEVIDGEVRLMVSKLEARPGTEFFIQQLQTKDVADLLRGSMEVVERGAKGVFAGTGILEVSVQAQSPQEASDAANAIATTYLRQNVERLSQAAERKLEFLNSQLPRLQREVEVSEQALLEQRSRSGPYQLSEGAKSILESLTAIEREISELQLQRTELSQTLTPEHPAMAAVVRKLEQLEGERARTNKQIAALPDAEARMLQLTRDSKVASELYIALLNQAQELKLAKAGTIGNVRIVDTAVPVSMPVEPRPRRLLAIWSLLGVSAALAAVFLRSHMNVKLEWAEDAERHIGIPVYATIPMSNAQVQLDAKGRKGRVLLSEADPKDIAVESLRSLRASLHFAMMDAKRNLVVITGSTPDVGKSFVSANLARLVADSGKKVLLVDADMRKGRMHKIFDVERSPGLSEVIAGQANLRDVPRSIGDENLFLVTTGKLPPNPAELLASDRYSDFVESVCKQFDLVIMDTPPILNLADTIVVARSAGALFVTVRGGVSTVPDVMDCVQRFAKNGIKVDGLIFNGLRPRIGSLVHPQYYHYRYRYTRYGSR